MTRTTTFEFLPDNRPYVVAEVGGNHGGDLDEAKRYVEAVAESGADAVKFQFYRGERLIVEDEPPLPQVSESYDSQQERFQDLELDRTEWDAVVTHARDHDIDFAASAFDPEMAEFAAETGPFVKIASGDLTHIPLLRHVASETDVPIVLSTGCATEAEIARAVAELPQDRLVLLHCVSSYPTPDSGANLQLMETLRESYDVPIGYSDHTVGTTACRVATANDACILEKHFTLDADSESGDHALSATPDQLSELVTQVETVASMFGDGSRADSSLPEEDGCASFRRSLATVRDVEEGKRLEMADLTALRPEGGCSPLDVDDLVGRKPSRALSEGTIIYEEDLQTD
jgi:sialic acid synthase SpsE